MATVHLRIGDLVWGKLGRYPPWPGKIVSPPKDLKKPRGKKCFFVKFFGTEDHAWIKVEQLKPYHPHKEEMSKANKGKRFQQAVDAVEEYQKKGKGKEQRLQTHCNSDDKKSTDSKGQEAAAKSILIADEDAEDPVQGSSSKMDFSDSDPQPSSVQREVAGTGFNWESNPAASTEPASKRRKIKKPSIQAADSTALNGSIPHRIGFLGLGLMGSGVVSNLLKMGHNVTVWNRTAEKCDLFIQEGAQLGRTPAEVVSMCDITFSCVSDPVAALELVRGDMGILEGISRGKCYVEMSTIDPATVLKISEDVTARGGRFLEAPLLGSQQLSNEGQLVILAAGDRSVYDYCRSCFQAMGKSWFFLGKLGNAAKMNLILNMVQGSFMATLAEGLTLAQAVGQSQQNFLDILLQGPMASVFVDQKCQNILQGNFKPDNYLKHVQKDLRLAIAMGDTIKLPTPMAAAANEVYKRAQALDQSDNDMSAVYRAYIH